MSNADAKARVKTLLEELAEEWYFDGSGPVGVNTASLTGDTPLIISVIRGDLPATLDLLAAGADPNAIGEDDFTPLHWGVARGAAFVSALLEHGAIPRGKNMFGETPQEAAHRAGDPEVVALLANYREA
jgi:ankyrin repeat protein